MIVYLVNGSTQHAGDTVPARYLPLSILREGNFDLNEFSFLYREGKLYYLALVHNRHVSEYPVGPALLALPVFLSVSLGPTHRDQSSDAGHEMIEVSVRAANTGRAVWLSRGAAGLGVGR